MANASKFKEESGKNFEEKVHIQGRSVLVTQAMKNYLLEKLSKVERFYDHIMDVQVTMDIQHLEHSIVILVHFDHVLVKAQAASTDMYASIDQAVKHLEEKIRRWKDKIQSKKKWAAVEMEVNVMTAPYSDLERINQEIEEESTAKKAVTYTIPKVIGSEKRPLKTLLVEEAMMKLELSDDVFLVFRDEKDRKLKVIYRRNDGNYGIIQPE